MNTLIRTLALKFARPGKEVISMTTMSKEERRMRLRELLLLACDWALRKLPGAMFWLLVRHLIRAMTGLSLNF